ncbi:MAG TPA: hypothetical protein VHP14_14765 [Anaerolineales bacterium]|nr:hypothetical protein [Anaerolineales bacterium]
MLSKSIKTSINVFVIGYPLFGLLYLVWLLSTGKSIYWDGYNLFTGIIVFLIVVTFLPFLVTLFISDLHTGWRLLISLLAFPLFCVSTFFWLDLPYYSQVREAQFDGHKYLLTHHNSIYGGDAYDWYLFECSSTGISCTPTLLYVDEYGEFHNDASVAYLIIDQRNHELHVVVDNDLLYTVGDPSRTYIPMSRSARRENYSYHLSRYEDQAADSIIYGLYECNAQYACRRIPFAYSISRESAARMRRLSIEIDRETNDVHVLGQFENESAELIFSYGDQPLCYVKECSMPDR